jgi:hypothetical protein
MAKKFHGFRMESDVLRRFRVFAAEWGVQQGEALDALISFAEFPEGMESIISEDVFNDFLRQCVDKAADRKGQQISEEGDATVNALFEEVEIARKSVNASMSEYQTKVNTLTSYLQEKQEANEGSNE